MSRRENEAREKMLASLPDPEKDSDFARGRDAARAKGTPMGVDPATGERASITVRGLYNETGDEQAAIKAFREVARAGGFGDVDLDQALDIRSLSNSVKAHNRSADEGRNLTGQGDPVELDRYGKERHRQAAQHQDNLVNAVGEALRQLERG